MAEPSREPRLLRVLGFWTLTIYGVGDILGAGIYALIGEVAGLAGSLSWLSFLVAIFVVTLTGFSYAELGRRFPVAGGESYFCEQAFNRPTISFLAGWAVFCSGLVSMATVSRAFAGYFSRFETGMPDWLIVFGFVCVVGVIAVVGIRISSSVNVVCTLVEASGLLLVVIAGSVWLAGDQLAAPADMTESSINDEVGTFAVLQAATLAFFAFIGFEDMVKMSEEVREPERTLPRALLSAILIASVVYIAVVVVATRVVAPEALSRSDAPLLTVIETALPAFPLRVFTVIALFAVANTGLANFVTSTRLVYGMSQQRLVPEWLGRVNERMRTPYAAVAACFCVALGLAMSGSLKQLAGATSCLILTIFLMSNLSLIVIRRRESIAMPMTKQAIPYLGATSCAGLLIFVQPAAAATAGGLMLVGLVAALIGARRSTIQNT